MPELPEVQSVVNGLQCVVGQKIHQVNILRARPLQNMGIDEFCNVLENQTITSIVRRAKYLLFELSAQNIMAVHLRMTGKFVLSSEQDDINSWTRIQFMLGNQQVLNFHDKRCLGTVELFDSMKHFYKQKKLGIEPLQVTKKELEHLLRNSQSPIKTWLLDQTKLVGIGNIYASEILFQAKISPLRQAKSLQKNEADALFESIHDILNRAIECNGTSISDFRGVDEKTGSFQDFLKVYGRKGENCKICKTPLICIRQQQRSTFYCPTCQS